MLFAPLRSVMCTLVAITTVSFSCAFTSVQEPAATVANNGIALKLAGPTGSFGFDSKECLLTIHQPQLSHPR